MVSESASAAPRAPFLVRSTSPVQCVLAFLAGAGLQHALGLPLPVLALQYAIIPFEEARLQARFGAEYTAYMRAVRRWL